MYIFNIESSAVLIYLVLLWQLRYYHNAICHFSDGNRKTWMLTICSSHQREKKNASLPTTNIGSALYPVSLYRYKGNNIMCTNFAAGF